MVLSNKISNFRLGILFFVTVIEMTIFSSPLLGWSSLVFVLKGEGVYSHLCSGDDLNTNISIITTAGRPRSKQRDGLCVEQEDRLNLALSLTIIVGAVYILICGWAIDRFGVKPMKIFSSVVYGISAGLLTITSSERPAMLIPALLVFVIGQVGLYLSALRSIVLYGKWQSFVNSVFCCSFGSSAVLFLIFKVLYEEGVSYQILCYGLICAILILLFNSIVIFPNLKNDEHNSDTTKPTEKQDKTKEKSESSNRLVRSDRLTALKDLLAHMKTGVFIGTCLFVGMCRLRLWFFLASFQQFIMALPKMDEKSVKSYANYYGWIQLSSVAIGPFVSAFIAAGAELCKRSGTYKHQAITVLTSKEKLALDCKCEVLAIDDVSATARGGEVRGCAFYFACSGLVFILINLLLVIPHAPLQIFSFILILLLRCFYSGAFSNLFLLIFPVKHFGKLFGIGNFSCSLVQILQYPVFIILENYFPGKILQLNIALLILSIPIAVGLPYYLWHLGNTIGSTARSRKVSTHA
ncbi:large neutral amino acids transporter small subunit 4-like [Actinia tenebrosa]|uniref:Large neutral amino acids transporter small subunit 4-like n=1 Tax=Actinia tenebrosa TaxID=6105 RepID=A0A6P8I003_ACTTE|nr:large neutral amino acids transporter small subunit 4-like [Actinia tenebrosa]